MEKELVLVGNVSEVACLFESPENKEVWLHSNLSERLPSYRLPFLVAVHELLSGAKVAGVNPPTDSRLELPIDICLQNKVNTGWIRVKLNENRAEIVSIITFRNF